jgi:hypothetical protein
MDLTNLKSTWKNAGEAVKSEADLQRMTTLANHPSLRKIRVKLLVEVIALTVFLFLYKDAFDGDQKPLIANILLVSSIVLYLTNNIIGYISVARPVTNGNLKMSLENYFIRIKRLAILSLLVSFLYSIALIFFFTITITFSPAKYLILIGVVITTGILTYFSFRNWRQWIKKLGQQRVGFD